MWLAELFKTLNPATYRKEHQKIMEALDNVSKKIDDLNAAIASETAQFQEVSDALRNHADGTETADLNALADKIDASIAKVKAIVPDAPPTTPTDSTTATP